LKYNNQIKSITIGSFDGIHLAHQALIDKAEAVVVIERNGGYLTPGYKRSFYVDKPMFFYHFDKIRAMSPEAFVSKIEEDFPALEKIVVGYDFSFGRRKAGDTQSLSVLFNEAVEVISEISLDGEPVHSRTIKAHLKEGNIARVNAMLGRAHQIDGRVIRGQGLGKKALVPTLNLQVRDYQLPQEGVYATRTKIEGVWCQSVSFIGHRVSTDGSFAVETHILDRQIETPPDKVWLEFQAFIRPNKKFESIEALKRQIEEDIECAKGVTR